MKVDAQAYARLLEGLLAEGKTVRAQLRGHSMVPAIPDGAVVDLRPRGETVPERGDVVLVRRRDGSLVCHRVFRRMGQAGKSGLQTWGDGAHLPDRPVLLCEVLGVVTGVGETNAVPAGPPRWRLVCRYLKYRVFGWLHHGRDTRADECGVLGQ